MAPEAALYVGIDAGGSGTRAALASADGEVLAIGLGGPSGVLGTPAGLRQLRRALAEALAPIHGYLESRASAARKTGLARQPGLKFVVHAWRWPNTDTSRIGSVMFQE